ncbi:hypothetical protein ME763_00270 [Streptomyces murinus]|uniref:hypothetical protein n=1 Tax=Streptomyces murinus TaxID=33900 RepID=UPI001555C625|nr:hypothetical protein [Streptomyces murinus]WDO04215.1 hypothetical protein ME763_00270 [Streptomyces murinus]
MVAPAGGAEGLTIAARPVTTLAAPLDRPPPGTATVHSAGNGLVGADGPCLSSGRSKW